MLHSLDLMILHKIDFDIDICRKDTYTVQCIGCYSFIPWHYKISWIRSLISRAKHICSNKSLFNKQLKYIPVNNLMSWITYLLSVHKSLCNKFCFEEPNTHGKNTSTGTYACALA